MRDACTQAGKLRATLKVLVALRVLRLRQVSAGRRLRAQDRRADLHPARASMSCSVND